MKVLPIAFLLLISCNNDRKEADKFLKETREEQYRIQSQEQFIEFEHNMKITFMKLGKTAKEAHRYCDSIYLDTHREIPAWFRDHQNE
jgi:hypothetical protein